jgi:hypothetical protein
VNDERCLHVNSVGNVVVDIAKTTRMARHVRREERRQQTPCPMFVRLRRVRSHRADQAEQARVPWQHEDRSLERRHWRRTFGNASDVLGTSESDLCLSFGEAHVDQFIHEIGPCLDLM